MHFDPIRPYRLRLLIKDKDFPKTAEPVVFDVMGEKTKSVRSAPVD